jgi:hypothetical protein
LLEGAEAVSKQVRLLIIGLERRYLLRRLDLLHLVEEMAVLLRCVYLHKLLHLKHLLMRLRCGEPK